MIKNYARIKKPILERNVNEIIENIRIFAMSRKGRQA